MVNNAQKLAKSTEYKLIASNIAQEGIESIGTLRDSFRLRLYDARDCFFTIDISNLDETKCYRDGRITKTHYLLKDDKTLAPSHNTDLLPVCINEYGWYSQDDNNICKEYPLCNGKLQKECRTHFTRNIQFKSCFEPLRTCVIAESTVTWPKLGISSNTKETLTLSQTFTRH